MGRLFFVLAICRAREQPLGLSRRNLDGGGRQRGGRLLARNRVGERLFISGLLHALGGPQRRGRSCVVGLVGRGRGRSGQRDARRLGEDQFAVLVLEPRKQADPPLRPTGRIPRQPEAVGRSQARIAPMMCQVFRGK
jgi:hypothetical protein